MNVRCVLVVAFVLSLAGGCTKKSEFVRDPVVKVTGTLLIDGKPEPMVAVRLNRVDGPDDSAGTSKMLTPSGLTDANGKFAIGTYDKGSEGDGAPPGKYTLTFQWGQINLIGGRYGGDKFKGKFADPKKSEHTVEVESDPIDLGEIDLSTK